MQRPEQDDILHLRVAPSANAAKPSRTSDIGRGLTNHCPEIGHSGDRDAPKLAHRLVCSSRLGMTLIRPLDGVHIRA